MLSLAQILITEIGPGCNLATEHARCPSAHPARWEHTDRSQAMSDDTLVECVVAAYTRHHFTGLWGTHYYCEPTLYAERLVRVTQRIRERVPGLRAMLWTNGTIEADLTGCGEFEHVVWSQYHEDHQRKCKVNVRNLRIFPAVLDNRLDAPPLDSRQACMRPFTEFILDCYGQHRMCCEDWRGRSTVGNVHDVGFDALVKRWYAALTTIVVERMTAAPMGCLSCGRRHPTISRFDEAAAQRAEAWRAERC